MTNFAREEAVRYRSPSHGEDTGMRRLNLIAALFFGSALTATASVATAAQCSSVADQSAYEVLSLRTQMILLATKCGRDQDYNKNFIVRFQPTLQANEREILAYFRRLYGGAGQGKKDTFSTELVNVMSQQANTQGAEFCPRATMIISEMNSLRSMDELPAYAAVKDLGPAGTSMCPTAAAPRKR
jgi:hypothetical protein